ncbi:MAG: protein kinase [Candidatus Rokubacteria bacterium]|nr:protein kinase [Candidatus Rokubacteria bacterium]
MTKRCPRCRKTYDEGVQVCPEDGAALSAGPPLDPIVAAALSADYRILSCLGSGGMGTVFLAEQIRVGNRKVALKVLHRRFSEDEEFMGRFENEAASTGRINHPNVITIYESKRASDGSLYIAMELVEGESLTERLRKGGRLPLNEAVEITSQCCKALQAAHRVGIVHRDIKPDNIMLTRDSDGALLVKILDFGIAKLKDSSGHTVTGSVLGTPAYMSYEQASGLSSEKLDGRSDIYSLGVVAYTMLVGHPPFRADTPVGYITKHLTAAPPPLRAERADLSAAVEAAVMRALEKDRDRRYQTAAEFAAALREAVSAPMFALEPALPVETTPTPPPPWRPRAPAAQPTEAGVSGPAVAPTRTPPPASQDVRSQPAASATPAPPAQPVRPAAREGLAPAVPPGIRPARAPAAQGKRAAASAPEPTGASVVEPTPSSRAPRLSGEGRPASRPRESSGEGMAAVLWGVRTLVSWGMTAYALVFLALFVWPLAAPFVTASVIFPVAAVGQPIVQQVAEWVPPIRIGEWDPVPLVLGVALLLLRPRITERLWRLETRIRARAAPLDATG